MAGVQKPEVTIEDILRKADKLKIDPTNIRRMQDMVQFDPELDAMGNMSKGLQSAIFKSGVGEKDFIDLLQKGGINLDLDGLKKQFANSSTWSKALGGLDQLKDKANESLSLVVDGFGNAGSAVRNLFQGPSNASVGTVVAATAAADPVPSVVMTAPPALPASKQGVSFTVYDGDFGALNSDNATVTVSSGYSGGSVAGANSGSKSSLKKAFKSTELTSTRYKAMKQLGEARLTRGNLADELNARGVETGLSPEQRESMRLRDLAEANLSASRVAMEGMRGDPRVGLAPIGPGGI